MTSIFPTTSRPWSSLLPLFHAVDDRVRGGSSQSFFKTIYLPQIGEVAQFYGFLDTTTLGGAGFASQAYSHSLPTQITSASHSGISLVLFIPPAVQGEKAASPPEGGGKGPVTSYVLNFKTTIPETRPDGRRESTISYEWAFTPSTVSFQPEKSTQTLKASWEEFKPTYRGRPVPPEDKPPKFEPGEITEMSFMARSNFAEQSGPFELTIVSLSATPTSSPSLLLRFMLFPVRRFLATVASLKAWLQGRQGGYITL